MLQFFFLKASLRAHWSARIMIDHYRYLHHTENLESMKLDLMPGFRLKWYYTGDDTVYSDPDTHKKAITHTQHQFVRIVYLIYPKL